MIDPIAVTAGIVQTGLYLDFFYVYFTKCVFSCFLQRTPTDQCPFYVQSITGTEIRASCMTDQRVCYVWARHVSRRDTKNCYWTVQSTGHRAGVGERARTSSAYDCSFYFICSMIIHPHNLIIEAVIFEKVVHALGSGGGSWRNVDIDTATADSIVFFTMSASSLKLARMQIG